MESIESRYRTILVGVDGSAAADRAVETAAAVALVHGAALHVVCAYRRGPDPGYARDVLGDEDYLVCGTAPVDGLVRAAADAAAIYRLPAIRHVIEGHPAVVLRVLAADIAADLVVLGGRERESRLLRPRCTLADELRRTIRGDLLEVRPAPASAPRAVRPRPRLAPALAR